MQSNQLPFGLAPAQGSSGNIFFPYELTTGQVPHVADTAFATLLKRSMEPPPPPRAIAPDVSEVVEAVILKALAPNPEDRFQSAGELARAFREATLSRAVPRKASRLRIDWRENPHQAPQSRGRDNRCIPGCAVLALFVWDCWC